MHAQLLSHVQLFVTPWTAAWQALLSTRFLQARVVEWVTVPFSRGSPQPRDWTRVSCIPESLQSEPQVQFSSVAQSCPTLCDPMNRSTPGLPVHHQLPEFTQTHAHRVGDAIQPSHPLSSPSPPAPNPYQHQGLFQWVSSSHEVAKVLEFQLQHQSSNEHPGLISFRMDWLDLLAVQGTLKSLVHNHSSKVNSSALSFLHRPTLPSIHDHWKNHSLD